MTEFFVEYSIGDDVSASGSIFTKLNTPRINMDGVKQIMKKIAEKENCAEVEIFIDSIAKINSN